MIQKEFKNGICSGVPSNHLFKKFRALQASLGVSQPTVSRVLVCLIQLNQVQQVRTACLPRCASLRTVSGDVADRRHRALWDSGR